MTESKGFRFARLCFVLVLVVGAVAPFAYMLRVAVSAPSNIHSFVPEWLGPLYAYNFVDAFADPELLSALGRSCLVAVASTAIVLALATPAAYACARLDFRGRRDFEFWVLSTRMLPTVIVVIPYFVLFRGIGIIDTVWALIIMHTVVNLALVFFLLRSFFADLPGEVIESAYIDGCREFTAFFRVAVPMVRSGMAAAAVVAFIFSWNELVFSLTLASGNAKTAPVAMFNFIQFQSVAVGPLMAAGTVVVAPVVVVLVLAHKQLVQGMSFGAVK